MTTRLNAPLDSLRSCVLPAYQRLEQAFDKPFGAALNPWRHLGALGFLLFWLIAVTGFYLFAVLDTSVDGVYRSIAWLTREQWYLGGVIRSLHRYGADAFIVVTLLHLTREFLLGRYSGFRSFSWLTGIPLLWFAYMSGIGGFWLNWDRLGQFSAVATTEWLDWLPFFATPLTRNFLSAAAVSDRLFSLLVFVHIGIPLLLLFGLWFHVQRINRAEVFPPRPLALATLATLLALALAQPVVSQGPADLARLPGALALDWFYLFLHPLMYASSPAVVWALVATITLFLLLLPLLARSAVNAQAAPIALVDPDNCNGCRRCFDDCPYAAIVMVPHPEGKPGSQLAQVIPDLCASCGICAGSCPSSTPFRSMTTLVTGIDMPQLPVDALRLALKTRLAALTGDTKIVVFGCDHGAAVAALNGPDVASLSLICTGMLPPAFIEYALREGAAGIMVTGCRGNGCAFRLGSRWTEERLSGLREPHLRASVPRDRLCIAWADAGEEAALRSALADFRRSLVAEVDPGVVATAVVHPVKPAVAPSTRTQPMLKSSAQIRVWGTQPLTWLAQGLLYALFALIIGTFSSWPKYRHLAPEQALIKLSFTHHGKRVAECRQRTPQELAKLPPNMRAPMQCERERSPVTVEVDVDGRLAYRHVAEPSGLSKDGASTVYQRLPLLAGEHTLAVRLKDSAGGSGFDYIREDRLTLKPGQVLVIDFNAEKGGITLI